MSSPLPCTLRLATPEDAEVIAHHRVAMFREMGDLRQEELAAPLLAASVPVLQRLMQEGAYVAYLAVEAGQVIAGAGVHVRPQLPRIASDGRGITSTWAPLLVNVYTEPAWRRQGVARALVRALMDWAAAQGFDQLALHASDAGRPLYVSLGFAASNEMRWSPKWRTG